MHLKNIRYLFHMRYGYLRRQFNRILRKSNETLSLLLTYIRYSRNANKVSQFITASTSSHFQSSLQLLSSILKHETNPIITYVNLGLLPSEISHIRIEFPSVEIVSFPFESHPIWFNMAEDAGKFAWKPNSIKLFHHDFSRIVVWMDAGCKLTSRISLVRSIAKANGLFILPANCSVGSLTHPNSIKALRFEDSVNLPMFSAAFIALDLEHPRINEIFNSWVENTKTLQIIAPTGSNWSNHRYDQSLISMLIHKKEELHSTSYRKLPSRFFGFLIHQDVELAPNTQVI